MNGRCENNSIDLATNVCDSCYGEYCEECQIQLKTRKFPLCKDCAVIISGVRGNAKPDLNGEKKTANKRRKALIERKMAPDTEEVADIDELVPDITESQITETIETKPEIELSNFNNATDSLLEIKRQSKSAKNSKKETAETNKPKSTPTKSQDINEKKQKTISFIDESEKPKVKPKPAKAKKQKPKIQTSANKNTGQTSDVSLPDNKTSEPKNKKRSLKNRILSKSKNELDGLTEQELVAHAESENNPKMLLEQVTVTPIKKKSKPIEPKNEKTSIKPLKNKIPASLQLPESRKKSQVPSALQPKSKPTPTEPEQTFTPIKPEQTDSVSSNSKTPSSPKEYMSNYKSSPDKIDQKISVENFKVEKPAYDESKLRSQIRSATSISVIDEEEN